MKYSPIIVLVTIAALLGTGCKKENNHSQRFSELLGKWQLTDYGVDSNRNGILESNEYITVPGDQLAEDEYYEDGTGKHYLSVSGGGS
jgi:hypothetical protein